MNDEIKEILDYLKKDDDKDCWGYVKDKILAYEEGMKLVNCITNLQQIEQDHQKLNGELREELEDYKSRCEKAMELLKEFYDSGSCPLRNISKAYEILNGDDKDEK